MERDFRTECRIDWPEIIKAAKHRRHELKLTQRRLAAVAGVSLPTVVHFEAGDDIRLSSALAILKVLEMLVARVEGTLRIRASGDGGTEPYQATFASYAGQGGVLESRTVPDIAALHAFLNALNVDGEATTQAFTTLARESAASILHIQLSPNQLRHYWPTQFSRLPG
jgi:transcriptional regulator with XRE-family HTH domain